MQFILITLAMLIIIGLSAYATLLLLRLRKQTQAREQAMAEQKAVMEAKQASLLADIRYIAAAMTEERCELSEGVVRIVKLFDLLSLTERVSGDYPDVFMHLSASRIIQFWRPGLSYPSKNGCGSTWPE